MCACEGGHRCRRCLEDEARYDGPDPHLEELAEKYRDEHAQRPEDVDRG